MVNEFKNEKLQETLIVFNREKTDSAFRNLLDAFISTNFLIPAQWDKDPSRNEKGVLGFEPNTQFQLSLIQNDKGDSFFPVFSSMDQLKKWDQDSEIHSLVMTYNQYMPFVKMALNQIHGIVIDPFGANVLLDCNLLVELDKSRGSQVSENPIHKGDSLKLRDPILSVTELQRAICEFGDSHPDILSIYLKERIVKDQPSHWFLVVDMINDDKQTIQDLGNFCTPVSYGKGFEFMFGSMELAKKIMADTIPTYVKVTK